MTFDKTTLFFNYITWMFIYVVANGLLFAPGSLPTLIVPIVFIIYSILINVKYNRFFHSIKSVYIYMVYISVLVFFSSNFLYSAKNVLKSFIPLLFFGVAIIFVKNYSDLNRLLKSMMFLGFLFIINIILSNIFGLGGAQYGGYEENFLQTGSIYSEGLNAMGYYLLLIPAIYQLYSFKSQLNKKNVIFSALVILIILLLVLKRGSLLIIISGYFILLFFEQRKKIVRYLLLGIIGLALLFPLYENMLVSRYEIRKDRLQTDSYKTEARFLENEIVINETLLSGDLIRLLFGKEILNSAGNYGGGAFGPRQLHNDYAQILHGSGLIGISLYVLMNISILFYYLRQKRGLILLKHYKKPEKILNSVFWVFFLVYFVLGFSGSIDSVIYNPIRFIFLGAIIGIYRHQLLIVLKNKNT